eukprot:m.114325 g.114325  ORF g.114325 m.114325 type:complete len:70 (+) comp14161_c0_seq3:909-1118(+)
MDCNAKEGPNDQTTTRLHALKETSKILIRSCFKIKFGVLFEDIPKYLTVPFMDRWTASAIQGSCIGNCV